MKEDKIMMNYNAESIEKEIINTFIRLISEHQMIPREAIDSIDYDVFVKNSNWFYSLPEKTQMDIRKTIHALRLVHK